MSQPTLQFGCFENEEFKVTEDALAVQKEIAQALHLKKHKFAPGLN